MLICAFYKKKSCDHFIELPQALKQGLEIGKEVTFLSGMCLTIPVEKPPKIGKGIHL